MPTNEERREVAEMLRVLADENNVTATPSFNHTLFRALGGEPPAPPSMPTLGDLEAYDKALLYRLADLIEPEPVCIANVAITAEQIEKIKADVLKELKQPDRTCRMEYDKSKRGVYCSHCGERMDVYTWEHHVDGTAGYLYPFCYWCGSKVVQE